MWQKRQVPAVFPLPQGGLLFEGMPAPRLEEPQAFLRLMERVGLVSWVGGRMKLACASVVVSHVAQARAGLGFVVRRGGKAPSRTTAEVDNICSSVRCFMRWKEYVSCFQEWFLSSSLGPPTSAQRRCTNTC